MPASACPRRTIDLISQARWNELPPKRLQILRELKSAGAFSVYALAKRLGRNYSNVHGDIQRLLALDLVEKNAAKC